MTFSLKHPLAWPPPTGLSSRAPPCAERACDVERPATAGAPQHQEEHLLQPGTQHEGDQGVGMDVWMCVGGVCALILKRVKVRVWMWMCVCVGLMVGGGGEGRVAVAGLEETGRPTSADALCSASGTLLRCLCCAALCSVLSWPGLLLQLHRAAATAALSCCCCCAAGRGL